jgi:hypothetical protein
MGDSAERGHQVDRLLVAALATGRLAFWSQRSALRPSTVRSAQAKNLEWSHSEDWAAFFGAACAGIEAPEPGDDDFAQFDRLHRQVFEQFAVNGKIQVDYETVVNFGQPLFR